MVASWGPRPHTEYRGGVEKISGISEHNVFPPFGVSRSTLNLRDSPIISTFSLSAKLQFIKRLLNLDQGICLCVRLKRLQSLGQVFAYRVTY
jgi:hypothetical protein